MKTKVISFRVTDVEYEAVLLAAVKDHKNVNDFVRERVGFTNLLLELSAEQKRLEARAKRAFKKAQANVAQ